MTLNKIRTDADYMAHGFTREEVPMIRRHDILFNKEHCEGITEEEREEMYSLAKALGL